MAIEEKDLTVDDLDDKGVGPEPASYELLEPTSPAVVPIAEMQEKVRGRIAGSLVVLLAFVVLFAFITLWTYSRSFSDLEKLMTIVFSPVIALVGTAIGYYFGGKSGQDSAMNRIPRKSP